MIFEATGGCGERFFAEDELLRWSCLDDLRAGGDALVPAGRIASEGRARRREEERGLYVYARHAKLSDT